MRYLIQVSDAYGLGEWYRGGEKLWRFLDEHDTATQAEAEIKVALENVAVIAMGKSQLRVLDQSERRTLTREEIRARAEEERAELERERQKQRVEKVRAECPALPYVCGECQKPYSSMKGLKLHLTKSHAKKPGHAAQKRQRVPRPELAVSPDEDRSGGVPGGLERATRQGRDLAPAGRTLSPE